MKKLLPVFFLSLALAGLALIIFSCNESAENTPNPETGKGGSMARFAITGNTLYIVSNTSLEVYDIENGAEPDKKVQKNMGIGIETIFPYENKLFIGATDGMYIYDNANPQNPLMLSRYTHIQSCDPVVVQGKYAYMTLRNGVTCRPGTTLSSLDVVDVSNFASPFLVTSLTMESPYGLGVADSTLFVCEGENGLKVMNIADPAKPVLKHHYKNEHAYDVIPVDGRLIMTGAGGIFQYDYNDSDSLKLLSKIPVL